jgi:uncharacterized UBP type Zn finger protein
MNASEMVSSSIYQQQDATEALEWLLGQLAKVMKSRETHVEDKKSV